ncbi:MAG: hypothetical protein IJ089_07535 [Clostridia bacterium]|nr:hypothetical protein [Clostridia bacterium]MBQ8963634.1 hypothetical protein [Clostridia bacterium]
MSKIKLDPEKKIHLYNRDFDEMRSMLDIVIRKTMAKLLGKQLDSASITLKIDIDLNRDVIADDNAPSGERPAIHPEIDYKINSTMQEKFGTDGDIIPKGSDELLVDEDGEFFLVSKEEASGQLSMFNTYDEYVDAVKDGKY